MDTSKSNVSYIGAKDVQLGAGHKVGEYEIEAKIGEGGFGSVFKAIHPVIGKVVAIKVLHRRYSAQPEMVSRFVAEARAVNQIRHRHIIDIFAFGQHDDGRHYYVMEYLDGMSLEEFIQRRGRIELAEAVPILRALARALDAAHAKGIAHRDLKPENVFMVVDEEGKCEPKLLDFGIAKLLSEESPQEHKTRTGAPIGTPQYMSPEQCRGRGVDHRTDIYGFGIMAYRMLTGVLPFDGEDYMDVLLAQIGQEAVPPSSLVPTLPNGVDQVIGWMLKKDPAERPPNLITAVRSLEDVAARAGIAVAPPTISAVYAAHTSPVATQRTPPVIRSMSDSALLEVPTLSSADLMDAGGSATQIQVMPAPPRRIASKVGIVVLGLAGAVAAGLTVNWALSGTKDSKAGKAAIAAASQTGEGTQAGRNGAAGTAEQPAAAVPDGNDAGQPAAARDAAVEMAQELVNITVQGTPPNTEVYGGQLLIGAIARAPGQIQLVRSEEPILLTFKAEDYQSTTMPVNRAQDGSIKVALKRKPKGARPPVRSNGGKKKPDDRNSIEDPFSKNP